MKMALNSTKHVSQDWISSRIYMLEFKLGAWMGVLVKFKLLYFMKVLKPSLLVQQEKKRLLIFAMQKFWMQCLDSIHFTPVIVWNSIFASRKNMEF